jgi:hypothetical protein
MIVCVVVVWRMSVGNVTGIGRVDEESGVSREE